MKISLSLFGLAAGLCALPTFAHAQSAALPLPAPEKADETSDSFVWIMAPPVGSRWQMRMFTRTVSSEISPSFGGSKAAQSARRESTVLQRMVADYDVLSRDQFGATTTRVTFRDMTMDTSLKINGEQVLLHNDTNNPLLRAFRGANFTVKQARNGDVWNVLGLEAMQKRIINAMTAGNPAARAQLSQLSRTVFSTDSARQMMKQSGTLPAYPIRAGENWVYAVDLPAGLPFRSQIAGTRTLNLLTPDLAFVTDDAVYSGKSSDVPMNTGQSKIVYNMSALQGGLLGTSRVERASGLTLESTIAQRLSGAITVKQLDFVGKVKTAETVPLDIVTTGRVVMQRR